MRYGVDNTWIDIIREASARSSPWWVAHNGWLGHLDVAGFEAEALYGGFAHEPFREYVLVARHRRASAAGCIRASHRAPRAFAPRSAIPPASRPRAS